MPRKEIAEIQLRKVRGVLAEAYQNIPHYRASFKSIGLDPGHIGGIEDLRRIPLLTKAEVVGGYPSEFRRDGFRTAASRRSSGTTGKSVIVDWSEEQLDVQNAMLARRMVIAGFKPRDRVVTMWPPVATWARSTRPGELGRPTTLLFDFPLRKLLTGPLGPVRTLRANAEDAGSEARALAELAPDFLMGRPSLMRRTGLALKRAGLTVTPRALLVGGETYTKSLQAEIEELYSSTALGFYGSSEFGALASECSEHRGAHLFEDFAVCEVIKDGEQVGPGEEGELVVTALHNKAMPLIRYKTGDMVRLSDAASCGCGSRLTRLDRFLGRSGDAFVAASGKRIQGLEIADLLEERFGLRDYQVAQMDRDSVELRLPPQQAADSDLVARIEASLESITGSPMRFSVKEKREGSWEKVRPVVGMAE